MSRTILIATMIMTTLIVGGTGVRARELHYEPIYYDDEVYLAINPGGDSANPNQLTFGCFNLGPDLNSNARTEPIPIYAILWSDANQHVCPNGALAHDHVATAIPGEPAWSPHWEVVFIIPIDESVLELPFTSAEAVEMAIAAGQVMVVETGLVISAPVVKRSGQ